MRACEGGNTLEIWGARLSQSQQSAHTACSTDSPSSRHIMRRLVLCVCTLAFRMSWTCWVMLIIYLQQQQQNTPKVRV